MANELRVFQDFLGGQLDAAIDDTDTTLSSPAFAAIVEIDTTNHILLTLDPDGVDGPPEVVKVIAHNLTATTCTVVRGQNGTSARAHADNTDWVAPVLASDMAQARVNVVDVAGTTDTIDASDLGRLLRYTDDALVTVTLPDGLPIGSVVNLLFWGASGGAIQSNGTSVVQPEGSVAQYDEVSCVVVATDTWSVQGAIS